ncbi:MAG: hypothetical protein H7232_15360 [Aeromicrobium sp.]|nr:hypothetical protein [Burkholderiales bacterium]
MIKTRHRVADPLATSQGRLVDHQPTRRRDRTLLGMGPGAAAKTVAAACALFLCFSLLTPAIAGTDTNTVKLRVAARVASFFRVQITLQADHFSITESDIRRGYIDLAQATHFSVTTNVTDAFVVDFQPHNNILLSVLVIGLDAPVEFGAGGGSAQQSASHGRVSFRQLGYRFHLQPDVLPGVYPWPMRISVHTVS